MKRELRIRTHSLAGRTGPLDVPSDARRPPIVAGKCAIGEPSACACRLSAPGEVVLLQWLSYIALLISTDGILQSCCSISILASARAAWSEVRPHAMQNHC